MADTLKLATFNLENLDDAPGLSPPLAEQLPKQNATVESSA